MVDGYTYLVQGLKYIDILTGFGPQLQIGKMLQRKGCLLTPQVLATHSNMFSTPVLLTSFNQV